MAWEGVKYCPLSPGKTRKFSVVVKRRQQACFLAFPKEFVLLNKKSFYYI